jgi:hypothetical protein
VCFGSFAVLLAYLSMFAIRPIYDKLAANYLAFIKLAAIRIWLRAYESAPELAGRFLQIRIGHLPEPAEHMPVT